MMRDQDIGCDLLFRKGLAELTDTNIPTQNKKSLTYSGQYRVRSALRGTCCIAHVKQSLHRFYIPKRLLQFPFKNSERAKWRKA